MTKAAPQQALKPNPTMDCTRCPGFCCCIYKVQVNKADIVRLAQHFGTSTAVAQKRFTKPFKAWGASARVLREKNDVVFPRSCIFLDPDSRKCTAYNARPVRCRRYPGSESCAYFAVLEWERFQHDDTGIVPVVHIKFFMGDWAIDSEGNRKWPK